MAASSLNEEEATKQMDVWMKEYQKHDEEIQTMAKTQRGLLAQYQENELVKQELDLVLEGEEVFKLVGPTLMKVDLVEAKSSVQQRLERFQTEIERLTDISKDKMKLQEELKQKAVTLRKQVTEAQVQNKSQEASLQA